MSDVARQLSDAQRTLLDRRLRAASAPGVLKPDLIPRRADAATAPLSFGQQRLWFLDQLEPGSAAATIDYALQLGFWVDAAVLERSINLLVARHEALRTTFVVDCGKPRAVISPTLHVPPSGH
jgi:hypothetical protein